MRRQSRLAEPSRVSALRVTIPRARPQVAADAAWTWLYGFDAAYFFRLGFLGISDRTSAASFRTLGLELCMSLPARDAFAAAGFRGAFAISRPF
jgi:hypothetical protein